MLALVERLRRSSAFQRVYSSKKSVSCPFFTLYVLQRQNKSAQFKGSLKLPLVGFVVSKKILKKANQRNRAKRRVREAYRCLRKTMQAPPAQNQEREADVRRQLWQWYALVWVINEKTLTATWEEICKKMEECLLLASQKYGAR